MAPPDPSSAPTGGSSPRYPSRASPSWTSFPYSTCQPGGWCAPYRQPRDLSAAPTSAPTPAPWPPTSRMSARVPPGSSCGTWRPDTPGPRASCPRLQRGGVRAGGRWLATPQLDTGAPSDDEAAGSAQVNLWDATTLLPMANRVRPGVRPLLGNRSPPTASLSAPPAQTAHSSSTSTRSTGRPWPVTSPAQPHPRRVEPVPARPAVPVDLPGMASRHLTSMASASTATRIKMKGSDQLGRRDAGTAMPKKSRKPGRTHPPNIDPPRQAVAPIHGSALPPRREPQVALVRPERPRTSATLKGRPIHLPPAR